MDKTNFVNGMIPDDSHFNDLQENVEQADRQLVASCIGRGILSGFTLSFTDQTATLSPGSGFDDQGRALKTAEPLTLDLSNISRPEEGAFKWLVFVVTFTRTDEGNVFDDYNDEHPLYRREACAFSVIEGVEGSRPDPLEGLIVGELCLDDLTAYQELTPDYSRRPSLHSLQKWQGREIVLLLQITASPFDFSFADFGLTPGKYCGWCQLKGGNTRFALSPALELRETGGTLYLYHMNRGTSETGPPPFKIGPSTIGGFVVGGRETMTLDLFLRKEL